MTWHAQEIRDDATRLGNTSYVTAEVDSYVSIIYMHRELSATDIILPAEF
jgi:hypothetical protein